MKCDTRLPSLTLPTVLPYFWQS